MAETLVLTTPEVIPQKTTVSYDVIFLSKDLDLKRIIVRVRGTNGEVKEFIEEDEAAMTLMRTLNKSNNSTKSEIRRIMEWLDSTGRLRGTVTGTPD